MLQPSKDEAYEVVTVYVGKNSRTYLAKEFMELGKEAIPIFENIHPSEKGPVAAFKPINADGYRFYND